MNIAIVVTKLTLSGGMERYTLDVINGLNQLNISPLVFTSKYDPKLLEQLNFTPIKLMKPKWLGKLGIHISALHLKYLKRKYRVSHLIGCNRNTEADLAICGGTHLGYLESTHKKVSFWDRMEISLEKKYYQNAQSIVAHSQKMARELCDLYDIPNSKISVIYPPINLETFVSANPSHRMAFRDSQGWEDKDIVLLFPSSGHIRKGLPYIIEQIQRTQDPSRFKLIVLGKKNPQFFEKFVFFYEFTNHIELLYQAVDFTVLASSYEPFGLVGPESVLCGTPCVFSNQVGATEILSQESCYIFDAKSNLDELAKLLDKLQDRLIRIDKPQKHISYDMSLNNHANKLLSTLNIVIE